MSSFAATLKKYYKRQGNKVIFKNGLTLNALAMLMWEHLGYTSMDPSILSKVLNGKRLFSMEQLNTFCIILNLPQHNRRELRQSLIFEFNTINKVSLLDHFTPTVDTIDFLNKLLNEVYMLFLEGKSNSVKNIATVIEENTTKLNKLSTNWIVKKEILKIHALNLYVKCKVENLDIEPKMLFLNAYKIHKELEVISKSLQDSEVYALSQTLIASAYGEYAESLNGKEKLECYSKAIIHGKKALELLPNNSKFYLFALRTISAAYSYAEDEFGLHEAWMLTDAIIDSQPSENYAPTLYLSGTFPLGAKLLQHNDPFKLKEKAEVYFNKSIYGTGVLELFDIKSELFALRALRTSEEKYITKLITRGKFIAEQEKCFRHLDFLNSYEKEYFS